VTNGTKIEEERKGVGSLGTKVIFFLYFYILGSLVFLFFLQVHVIKIIEMLFFVSLNCFKKF
jgi:hypothetical protein